MSFEPPTLLRTARASIGRSLLMADYIIVGGGSAGCVLAARLSEDANCSVLLLEAGPRDIHPLIHMPAGFTGLNGRLTWGYKTAPLKHANSRSIDLPVGRVLGGSSSVNAMIFCRGSARDYDSWATTHGCAGWSYREVLPYFRRCEANETFADEFHGNDGPVGVSHVVPHPLTLAFVRSAQQAGIPYNADFNGARQEGCGLYQATIRNGRRCSTAVAYLRMARQRKNLQVRTGVTVHNVLVKNGRAIGVNYQHRGRVVSAYAEREVILAAGSIGSPKLLLLSGIGPADSLRKFNIPVVHDLAGVGQNLQDHGRVEALYQLNGVHSLDKYKRPQWAIMAAIEYVLFNRGPITSNFADGGAFWWSDRHEAEPDLQFHFIPAGASVPYRNGCSINCYNLRPRSRGSITLQSADPNVAPLIDSNHFEDPYDLDRTVEGVKLCQTIMAQPAIARYLLREFAPGSVVRTKEQYSNYVRNMVQTGYHPVGTCKMGIDESAVVGPDLRLRGIDALRVCDASIMPRLVSSNTNAPTIMIGEKAADLIRGISLQDSAHENSLAEVASRAVG
jgi:choline dehydrogenase-like flavoprotein